MNVINANFEVNYNVFSTAAFLDLLTVYGGEPSDFIAGLQDTVADLGVVSDTIALPEFVPAHPVCEFCGAEHDREAIHAWTWKLWQCPSCGGMNDKYPS